MSAHNPYMLRCLQLAAMAQGQVAPNPMVGCLVVHNDKIIGEGYHQNFGGSHAEVNAIESVSDPSLLPESTLYVSLEPCSHFGKTPPCSNLIIEKGIKKVVIACKDPFNQVNGSGIQQLINAGIEVITGIMEEEAKEVNKRFFTYHLLKRPYVILKWAETINGLIAGSNTDEKQISGSLASTLLHKWRAEEDAFIIGTGTLISDNPKLTTRKVKGKNPLRMAIDLGNKAPLSLHFFDGSTPTILFSSMPRPHNIPGLEYIKAMPDSLVGDILNACYHRQIQSLVVEGGAGLIQSFINAGIGDEIRILRSKNKTFNSGLRAPFAPASLASKQDLIEDELLVFEPCFT